MRGELVAEMRGEGSWGSSSIQEMGWEMWDLGGMAGKGEGCRAECLWGVESFAGMGLGMIVPRGRKSLMEIQGSSSPTAARAERRQQTWPLPWSCWEPPRMQAKGTSGGLRQLLKLPRRGRAHVQPRMLQERLSPCCPLLSPARTEGDACTASPDAAALPPTSML